MVKLKEKTIQKFVIPFISITIYKENTNFWDDFFIIPNLPLKKTTKKN
jgi:hypothetical protein